MRGSQIREMLDKQWANKSHSKIDWLQFEQQLDDILSTKIDEASELSASEVVRAAKELLDATTRRGHFDPDEYFPTLEKVE